ncbi:hypothetical protein BBK82_31765 [Lentzea guizhouensis]|uniref:Transferase n=1 Tax=Lentzea guizhouensis TaxID=1586287 RepID=A0A1B2HQH9_9PSEU|nr:hypothetical protein [Lentzea guizhouensis]ANZ39942.1 hypothetical protein BBK82_31765 [Lentzea guizhouensis]
MRTWSRVITAVAVVLGYIALMLAITAGVDLRKSLSFEDAPTKATALLSAIDRKDVDEIRAIDDWFDGRHPSGGDSYISTGLAADLAGEGRFERSRSYANDLPDEIVEDQAKLDAEFDESSARAVPWVVIAAVFAAAALVFRRQRQKANADVVEVVSQVVPKRPVWRRPVFLLVSGVGYVLLVAGFVAVVAATRANELPWAVRGLFLAGGVIALPIAYFVLRYSRPRSVRGAAQALRADWRRPVLYLRGFGDDPDAAVVDGLPGALPMGMLTIHSREEQLIGALGAFGPVVAVGQPREALPRLGAARFYLPDEDWQAGVLQLMEMSQLIVLRLGDGDGVWWEVDQAVATQPPGKLVLLIPGGRQDLADRLDAHLPKPVKVTIDDERWTAAVVAFDRNWVGQVQGVGPFPGEKNRYGSPVFYVARAMQEALRVIGSNRRGLGVRTNGQLLAVYGKVLLLVPGLFLVVQFLRFIFLF